MAHSDILSRHDTVHDLTISEMIACHRATSSISRSTLDRVDENCEITRTSSVSPSPALLFNVLYSCGIPGLEIIAPRPQHEQLANLLCAVRAPLGFHITTPSPQYFSFLLPKHDMLTPHSRSRLPIHLPRVPRTRARVWVLRLLAYRIP